MAKKNDRKEYNKLKKKKADNKKQQLSDIGRCLSDFLNGLETEKRVLFVRRYWYGMAIDELADMSGRSKSSVKTTLFRIRAELKKYLDEEGVYL